MDWREQLTEAICVQLGADAETDATQLQLVAAAMERYLAGAIGEDCETVLHGDARLLSVAALRAQLLYDPLGVAPQQAAAMDPIVQDLSEQLRCEYRRRTEGDCTCG